MSKFSYDYPRPALTVDNVLFSFDEEKLNTLLIRRGQDPFKGMWAYPGGFVEEDETAEQAAPRELWEETGVHGIHLDQLFTETALNRDPRGWIVSVIFFAVVPSSINTQAGDDAKHVAWHPIHDVPTMVFGHEVFLNRAIKHCQQLLLNNVFGKELLTEEFDLKSLYKLYLQLINIPEQVEKIVKRLINYNVLIQIGEKWHFEKGRYEAVRTGGFLV